MKLDILIPVRNGGHALSATLRSLSPWSGPGSCRVVISDNFSTDGNPWTATLAGLDGYRVECVRPPAALDRVAHWNWLAGHAAGDAVKLVMAGDLLHAAPLRAALQALEAQPDLAFTFGRWELWYPGKTERLPPGPLSGRLDRPAALRACLDRLNPFGGLSGIVFRREGLGRALPFELRYPWTADIRLCLRCLETGACWGLPDVQYAQDLRIPRLSSSWRAIGLSFREEWGLLSEILPATGARRGRRVRARLRNALLPAAARLGRAAIPPRPRKWLGALFRILQGQPA